MKKILLRYKSDEISLEEAISQIEEEKVNHKGWSVRRLNEILDKPDDQCDGAEIHIKRMFQWKKYDSIFRITGLIIPGFFDI